MHYATWVGHHTLKLVFDNVKASMACACGTDVVYTLFFLPWPIIMQQCYQLLKMRVDLLSLY